MSAPRPVAVLLLGVVLMLAGCMATNTTVRNGVVAVPPTAAAQEAARLAELRYRAKAHGDLAAAYYERGQFGVALEEANESIQIDPAYVGGWNLRGLVYMALREDRDAEDSFRQGYRLAPNDAELQNNYGYFLCDRGREREGLQRLDAVLRDPLYATPEKALVNAAQCTQRLHDEPATEAYLRRAVHMAPTYPPAATQLAGLLERSGRRGEAREALRPLLRATPPPQDILLTMARLDDALNDPQQAREHRALLQRYYPEGGAVPATSAEPRP